MMQNIRKDVLIVVSFIGQENNNEFETMVSQKLLNPTFYHLDDHDIH